MDTHSEDDGENARTNRIKQEELRRRVGPVPHLPSPYSNSSEGDISDDSDVSPAVSPLTPLLTTNQRKRSGALQRQQLLEIIQANMEKNNLSFHTSRYGIYFSNKTKLFIFEKEEALRSTIVVTTLFRIDYKSVPSYRKVS